MTFGDEMESAMRTYLAGMGATSMGKISGRMFKEFADEFYAKWQDAHPATPKVVRKRVPKAGDERNSIPPSLEMVRQRIRQMGYTFNAERFVSHYDSNGWRVGKVPMVDWFAACVTFQGDAPKRPVSEENPVKPQGNAIPEPANWRTLIANDPDDGIFANSNWASMQIYYQKRIARKCENGGCAPSLGQLISFPQTG